MPYFCRICSVINQSVSQSVSLLGRGRGRGKGGGGTEEGEGGDGMDQRIFVPRCGGTNFLGSSSESDCSLRNDTQQQDIQEFELILMPVHIRA